MTYIFEKYYIFYRLFTNMNIFFLSICVKRCARYHFDKHVIKMILELCQLLCTAWHVLDSEEAFTLMNDHKLYKKTHQNHPCAIWARGHINNYIYVAKLALALCDEWRFRYDHPVHKIHGCESLLLFLIKNPPKSISKLRIESSKNNPLSFTLPMPQAMFEECRWREKKMSAASCMTAYRKYYMSNHKKHLISWTKFDPILKKRVEMEKPYWWKK